MCDCWWCCKAKSKQDHHHQHHHNNPQTILIIQSDDDQHENHHHPTAAITMILTSWLNRRRIRYLFLVLCSPLLLPFLCVAFPLLFAAEICLFLCRRRRRLKATLPEDSGEDGLRRCEEGGGGEGEGRLLQRYLEDQLILVVGSVYDYGCGDEDNGVLDGSDDGVHGDTGVEFFERIRTPLLQ